MIPRSSGYRRVRWSVQGRDKRGGARVIYFNRLADGKIGLLTMYLKAMEKDVERRALSKLGESIDE